jgi:hypothetical protein
MGRRHESSPTWVMGTVGKSIEVQGCGCARAWIWAEK